ncbi:MAG: thiamine-monophosphate kinase [Dehalococcoidia bacterium]|nr:MAG: thiamine-monophosphate kinase [Dehalococcoidia bacterium]
MKVSELGEFGLIDLLAEMVRQTQTTKAELVIGIGDDGAAWHGDTSTQLATVDSLIEDVHFSLASISWQELGWKAMAVNLSDIAAMGGVPSYALVSLALPKNTEVDNVTALYKGMIELAGQFGVVIAGGDTSRAPIVVITVTILGSTQNQGNNILTRSAAVAGEKIAVTGYLGGAAAGLEMVSKGLQLDAETTACLKRAFLHPHPRIAEGQILVEQ